MLGRMYDEQICSIARALEIVGERWSLLILREAIFAGATRFSDIQRSLKIAPNILASRLENFVTEGLFTKSEADEYHVTRKGLDFIPTLLALREWGDRWASPEGPPLAMTHADCGGKVELQLHCKGCAETPRLKDLNARPTKAMHIYQQKKSGRA